VLTEEERAEYPLPQLAITPAELSTILKSIAETFTCTTLADAVTRWSRREDPARPLLALTFDDGQLDNATRAAPVLDSRGLKATFFVVSRAAETGEALWHDRLAFALSRALELDRSSTASLLSELSPGARRAPVLVPDLVESAKSSLSSAASREAWIGRLEQIGGGRWQPRWDGMLRFADLRALHKAGHEIGSHTLTHPLLNQCTDSEVDLELRESKRQLEREIGSSVTSFCYPNGNWSPTVMDAVRRAGYTCAVTTQPGANPHQANPFALRRCDLSYTYCVDRHGRFSPPRLAWRLVRRSWAVR
jgi:peptidoglycan/xylan/chitin deacetylase (PgdA/CDA1 family)